MTSDTRRRLALLLVGLAAMLVGLTVTSTVMRDACLDAGGRWLAQRRCDVANGQAPAPGRAYLLGGVAGLAAALVLWRIFTFYATRARRAR